MPDSYWGIDYGDGIPNPSDATQVNIPSGVDGDSFMTDTLIRKGRYRLVVRNPESDVFVNDPISTVAGFVDESGNYQSKAIRIDSIKVDLLANRAVVDITVLENPIPLIAVWGAVFVACAIAGALATNSIIESVEVLLDKPISWLIVILVGFVLLAPFIVSPKST